jgi:hypothetical protein
LAAENETFLSLLIEEKILFVLLVAESDLREVVSVDAIALIVVKVGVMLNPCNNAIPRYAVRSLAK